MYKIIVICIERSRELKIVNIKFIFLFFMGLCAEFLLTWYYKVDHSWTLTKNPKIYRLHILN